MAFLLLLVTTSVAIGARKGSRVELQLHAAASVRHHREIGAFVRYCIARIERDVEPADWWTVKIVPANGEFCCEVVVEHRRAIVQSNGAGLDSPLAAWEALCRVEQLLRDNMVASEANEVSCGGR